MIDTQKLRQRILDLAIRGKLVPQDPNDEPASVLLERIRAEKERLIAEGKIKRPKAKKTTDKSHNQKFSPPFEIPDSWEWVRLGDIAEIKGGTTIPKENELPTGRIKYIKVSDFNLINNQDEIIESQRYADKWNESHVIKANSILFPKRGGAIFTNKKRITREPILADLNIMSVHPYQMFEYLQIWFLALDLGTIQSGSNIPQINNQDLEPLMIPIPPLKEQVRIAHSISSFLYLIQYLHESAHSLSLSIKTAKSKILDLAMQGKLVPQDPADEPAADMLRRINPKAKIITDTPHYPNNWIITNHNDVAQLSGGSQPAKSEFVEKPKDGYIRLFQIRDYGDKPVPIYIPLGSASKISNEGDVLLARYGASLGKVFIAQYGAYNVALAKSIFDKSILLNSYVYLYYKAYYFQNKLNAISRTAQAGFNTSDFEDLLFPIPPLNEQKRIVAKVEELYSVLDKIEASLRS